MQNLGQVLSSVLPLVATECPSLTSYRPKFSSSPSHCAGVSSFRILLGSLLHLSTRPSSLAQRDPASRYPLGQNFLLDLEQAARTHLRKPAGALLSVARVCGRMLGEECCSYAPLCLPHSRTSNVDHNSSPPNSVLYYGVVNQNRRTQIPKRRRVYLHQFPPPNPKSERNIFNNRGFD